jgi:predicted RNA-binding Zn ribbon-like protein
MTNQSNRVYWLPFPAMGPSRHSPYKFELTGGELCLDFANTIGPRHDPDRVEDHLRSYTDLVIWARQTGSLPSAEAEKLLRSARDRTPAAQRVFARAVHLREAIYAVLAARIHGRKAPPAPLHAVDREAARATAHRHIVCGSDREFSWSWGRDDDLDRPLWPVALSIADLLTSSRLALVRECALETCGWLFLDTSRNQTRRWCDMKVCGNRAKARRFYERVRAH